VSVLFLKKEPKTFARLVARKVSPVRVQGRQRKSKSSLLLLFKKEALSSFLLCSAQSFCRFGTTYG
jgi:hypothetical protein